MGQMVVQAYETYRNNAELDLMKGNYASARKNFLSAAEVALGISEQATQTSIKEQYFLCSKTMLSRAQNECNPDRVIKATPAIKDEPKRRPTKEAVIDKSLLGFQDIAGLEDVKKQLYVKVVYPLKYPKVNNHYKRSVSNTMQIMLYGPPGTGKTMFAEAICVELGMAMHRRSAAELIGSYLGESSKNLMEFLEEAQADESERILIFIDEFDAIASKRGNAGDGASAEINRMVNTLLQGVDNIVKTNQDKLILFVTTTNMPWSIDPALLRGQRFDTQIYVGIPDPVAIKFLVNKHLDIAPLSKEVNIDVLIDRLIGFSAADIKTICEKITDEPVRREYERLEAKYPGTSAGNNESEISADTDKPHDCVTLADVEKVLSSYRNSITPKMIQDYDKYLRGEKVDQWG